MMSTKNKFKVGIQEEDVVILLPKNRMSKEDALNLAAWLAAENVDREFLPLLQAVLNT